jgi:hypothetical protein
MHVINSKVMSNEFDFADVQQIISSVTNGKQIPVKCSFLAS